MATSSQHELTSALKTSTPAQDHHISTDSDDEEWHDAPDGPTLEPEAHAPESSSRPVSPVDPKKLEQTLKQALDDANTSKTRGNELFREANWQRALEVYLEGLHTLPERTVVPKDVKGKGRADEDDNAPSGPSDDAQTSSSIGSPATSEPESMDLSTLALARQQCAVLRSILNSNIAACHVKLGDHKAAVEYCTNSLLDVPTYGKALQRRASSNEALGTWASLSAAEKDYQAVLDTPPPDSPLRPQAQKSLKALKPRLEAAQKAEMDEMLDKLKGLGNSVLGRFGMSTDNFKFTPNGQGGYSMNFTQ